MDARSSESRMVSAVETSRPRPQWRRQMLLFRRRSGLFILVAAGGFCLACVGMAIMPLHYVATADVVIDPHREQALDLRQNAPDPPAEASVDTQVELLKSRALAERVVGVLSLDRDPEFNAALRHRPWTALTGRPQSPETRHEAVVDRLVHQLKVARVGFTYVIGFSVRSRSPETAASIANAFTSLYLQQQLEAKSAASRRASDLLGGRLGGLRAQVGAAEQEVEHYKAAHGLMTLAGPEGETATEQEISNLDSQLAAASGERAEAEARLSAATARTAAGGPADDLGEVLNSPVVQELRKQRDEAAKQIAELQGRYGPRHPDLLKAERQRAELDAQIAQEIDRVVSNLRVQVEVARSHSRAIASAVAAAKAELARNNSASVELKQLQQNLDAVRTLYQSFLERSKLTLAQDGMAQADARLVSAATAPLSPAPPSRLILLGAALASSMLAGLLAIWIAEAREDGLYDTEDVEARLGVSCLGLIPLVDKRGREAESETPVDLLLSQPDSGFSEAFRALKAELLIGRSSSPIRTIAVTSALPGEGKTTTSLCLGRVMAQGGAPTVVVDCDLRRRAMSRLLAASPKAGLLEVLSGAADLDNALVSDGPSGLSLLPLGDEALAEEDIFDSTAMARLLETLRRRFKTVLLDTAPVLMVAETPRLASKVDAVLLLTRWGRTPAEAAANAVKRLEGAGAYVAGAALTQVDLRYVRRHAYDYADDYPFYRSNPAAGDRSLFKRQGRGSAKRA